MCTKTFFTFSAGVFNGERGCGRKSVGICSGRALASAEGIGLSNIALGLACSALGLAHSAFVYVCLHWGVLPVGIQHIQCPCWFFILERCQICGRKLRDRDTAVHGNTYTGTALRPMTMETRCSKVIFPNYSKKKPAEDTLVPPLWGTREENLCFSRIICSRCCTRRNLRFHVENCQHADQNSSRDDRPSIST